ncbi:MAG: hypothetical protein RLZZ127_55 [Planctomycetota bacterium]|jgi:hypothetical protein
MTYAPTVNPGDQRERVWRVQGENANGLATPGAVPWMRFHWERAIRTRIGDPTPEDPRPAEAGLGTTVDVEMRYQPGAVFQLYDPTTGEPIPGATMTHEQYFAATYSLGMASRLAFDAAQLAAAQAAQEPEPENP